MTYVIAIDGPSGAGKGYLAHELSKMLNILYVDTGAMYRAFGLYCIEKAISLDDEVALEELLKKTNISFQDMKVCINGEEYESKIRTEQVGMYASNVSKIFFVRSYMVELQRNIAKDCSVVMEGRDIGSVVFPNADVKIYLTASCVERAKRRQLDLRRKGIDIRLEDVIKEIEKRDTADITKPISPLVKCDDAIEIDTTELSKDEVVLMVIDILKKRGLMERG